MITALLNNLSIRGKLSAIILIVSILLLSITSIGLISSEFMSLRENLKADLFTLASIIGSNSSVGLAFNDDKAVMDTLSSLAAKPNITSAHIFTIKGNLFANYYRENAPLVHYEFDNDFILKYFSHLKEDILVKSDDFELQLFKNIIQEKDFIQHYFEYILHTPLSDLKNLEDSFVVYRDRVNVFKKIIFDNNVFGIILIQSDLAEFNDRLYWYIGTLFAVMLIALFLASLLTMHLQKIITTPVYNLLRVIASISDEKNYSLRVTKTTNDEVGKLIDGFNNMLVNIEERDNQIISLNEQLAEENSRMGAELDVTRKLQQMVLPTSEELDSIEGLDIAGFMTPADEVGGDYYDILQHNGRIKIGIGDVTGHGLESGVIMMMVQTAVRTLLINDVTDPKTFLAVLNHTIFENVRRMQSDKNLTLTLLDYEAGMLRFVGQHEDILVVRQNGEIEHIDTVELGFMIGLKRDISNLIQQEEIPLAIGEGIVLYTDGITEAHDKTGDLYGIERLCQVIKKNWQHSAQEIKEAAINDILHYIGDQRVADDITLLIIKRMA